MTPAASIRIFPINEVRVGPIPARFSRDVGYHEPLLPFRGLRKTFGCSAVRIPHLAKTSEIPGFACSILTTAAYAAFFKESRMKFVCSNEPRSIGFLMGRGQDSVRRTRSGADWLISRNYYKDFTVATSFLGDFRGHIMRTRFL